jgi:hypothetical protein
MSRKRALLFAIRVISERYNHRSQLRFKPFGHPRPIASLNDQPNRFRKAKSLVWRAESPVGFSYEFEVTISDRLLTRRD